MSDGSNLQQSAYFCQGFSPIIPPQPRLLILGTMPSVASLEEAFYYAHPRNAFWPIIGRMVNRELKGVDDKIAACRQLGILLWDVLQFCEREGSLDSAIKAPQANDFQTLFERFPQLKHVAFNGQAAEKLFTSQVLKKQLLDPSIQSALQLITLPSTSPANARLKIDDKYLLWQEKLSDLL
ncbi:DNA-deoxyinosine glycosylase [Thiomicrorhabdus heinhorstiae]|uniref:DNA-deoxyinosine glycosylase n=1 Tax=Thiomicrorhabdus heinhorstiae TaxID=2748010 RepID=A0ABS0BUK1_9GAMM|nr:DNA-deoxyinosine glycosylase [Thiomicrorhabdus heinhorstiae]MBF6056780.1 DNA-deoxyinosine glycosylase [Thiomicrorhabdus heinhorstiae]